MDTLSLSKADVKSLIIVCALVPVLSFIAGFSLNGFSHVPAGEIVNPPTGVDTIGVETARVELTQPQRKTPQASTERADPLEQGVVLGTIKRAIVAEQYIVQAGLFTHRENAKRMADRLDSRALNTQIIREIHQGQPVYRVIVGAFASRDRAQNYRSSLRKEYQLPLYVTSTNAVLPIASTVATL